MSIVECMAALLQIGSEMQTSFGFVEGECDEEGRVCREVDPNWSFPSFLPHAGRIEVMNSIALKLVTGQCTPNAQFYRKPDKNSSKKSSDSDKDTNISDDVYIWNKGFGRAKWFLNELGKEEKLAIYKMLTELIKLQGSYQSFKIIPKGLTFQLRSKSYCLSEAVDIDAFKEDGLTWANED